MNGRIAILCPTRDRADGLKRLVQSVKDTSSKADVLAYVDVDQEMFYENVGCRRYVGPRIGPVASANKLAELYPKYDVYGFVTDDSIITTPGWDDWLLDVAGWFTNRIAVISPYHNHGNHVDMPFVTREWMNTVGWYACPETYHYCWPIITGLIGEMSAIVHAPMQKFAIDHDYVEGTYMERRQKDAVAFFDFVSLKLPATVEKVREALKP